MGKVIMSGIVPKLTKPTTTIPLSDCTWAEIRAISDAGDAANYFAVGDTKNITINGTAGNVSISNLTIDVFIIGIDHNSAIEGANRIHFQIGKINGVAVALVDSKYGSSQSNSGYFSMNIYDDDMGGPYSEGGWNKSKMRRTVLGSNGTASSPASNTLLAALPSDLRAVMKSVTKYTDNTGSGVGTDSSVTATTDYLPLLSEYEYHGAITKANSAEQNYQAQYDYYKAGNSKVKYKHNATGTACMYLTRSPNDSNGSTFCVVSDSGAATTNGADYSRGVSPLFCV